MYQIIEEYDGKNKEFTIIDNRTFKTLGTCNTIEEARSIKEKLIQSLYKGSGVLGNTPTL